VLHSILPHETFCLFFLLKSIWRLCLGVEIGADRIDFSVMGADSRSVERENLALFVFWKLKLSVVGGDLDSTGRLKRWLRVVVDQLAT
jgi:hypothetical protein